MELLAQLFPGLATFAAVEPPVAIARVVLIIAGFILAYLGFERKLEPLIMIPMGIGMICVNCGVLYLNQDTVGTIFLDPLVSDPDELMNIMQINFLQPVYNMLFSNGLIACLVFLGIGVRSDLDFLLSRPWTSVMIALFAEMGSFAALAVGVGVFGMAPKTAASIATIGGADGPMVLFTSLQLAPELFVPISIVVVIVVCGLLCLLLPMAAPLIMSFFLGVAIKEAEVNEYVALLENGIMYSSTLFLGLLLGVLCEASTILNPVVLEILILGVIALAVSGIGGLLGGWILYVIKRGKFNPVIGIAGVSCVPTTAKLAQRAVSEENPFAIILPVAMGANICGVITSAVVAGVFISTISLVK